MIVKKYTIAGELYAVYNYGDGWDVKDLKRNRVIEEGCSFKDAIECMYEDAIGYVPAHYALEVDA